MCQNIQQIFTENATITDKKSLITKELIAQTVAEMTEDQKHQALSQCAGKCTKRCAMAEALQAK
jgi:tRNA U34 5-carboxymethylaminomethyl modifying GTPase MnmE/TrmE